MNLFHLIACKCILSIENNCGLHQFAVNLFLTFHQAPGLGLNKV